jgi:hypothetical protein
MIEVEMDLDFTPEPRWLNSEIMRSHKLSHERALAELIDNSHDAGANNFTVDFGMGADKIICKDDGLGVQGGLAALFRLGHHAKIKTSKRRFSMPIGRYGVGFKHAAISLSEKTIVETSTGDRVEKLGIEWMRLMEAAAWKVPKNDWKRYGIERELESRESSTYTEIFMYRCRKKHPRGADFKKLCEGLSRRFFPLLERGFSIHVCDVDGNKSKLRPPELPPGEEELVGKVDVEGYGAKYRVRLIESGAKNTWLGLDYCWGPRVVLDHSALGLGDAGTGLIAGIVWLSENWPLATNKDEIEYREELGEAMEAALKPIIDRAKRRSEFIKINYFSRNISAMLNKAAIRAENRNPTGAVRRIDTGRERKRANKLKPQSGKYPSGGLRVQFEPWSNDGTEGRFDPGSKAIIMNTNHPWVKGAMNGNPLGNPQYLVRAAAGILEVHNSTHDPETGQKQFTGYLESNGQTVAKWLAEIPYDEPFESVPAPKETALDHVSPGPRKRKAATA